MTSVDTAKDLEILFSDVQVPPLIALIHNKSFNIAYIFSTGKVLLYYNANTVERASHFILTKHILQLQLYLPNLVILMPGASQVGIW